jgi:phosphatidylserine/phosphatidylglycerophosphate/cardiolipin synthase-like enzyme
MVSAFRAIPTSFVTSANFTEAAQERNIEAGVLLDDGTFARVGRLGERDAVGRERGAQLVFVQARRILAAFSAGSSGVLTVDGSMVDEAVVRRARQIVEMAGESFS